MKKIYQYIKLMRCHHYIKNLLVFLPIIFSKNIFNLDKLKITIIGALAFCFLSSIVYILNDIMDIEADKRDEKKKNRPIASGQVTIKSAVIIAIILFVISILLNIYIKANIISVLLFYGYFIINILYSMRLKHIPILDIVILASGFIIRLVYGSNITGVEISNWLYLTILSFSFYMGLGKRRNEFKMTGDKGRKVLAFYNESFLNNNMYMCLTLGIVFYSLWCIDVNTAMTGLFNIIWTVPLVIIICMKYTLNIENHSNGDPVDVILNDWILLTLGLVYSIIMFLWMYIF